MANLSVPASHTECSFEPKFGGGKRHCSTNPGNPAARRRQTSDNEVGTRLDKRMFTESEQGSTLCFDIMVRVDHGLERSN